MGELLEPHKPLKLYHFDNLHTVSSLCIHCNREYSINDFKKQTTPDGFHEALGGLSAIVGITLVRNSWYCLRCEWKLKKSNQTATEAAQR